MSYNFTFDLSKLSVPLFKEIAKFTEQEHINKKLAHIAHTLVKKFHINELTGLSVDDSVTIIEDLLAIQIKNLASQTGFQNTKKRAIFLPHCCRKYLDNRCQAAFNPDIPTYQCRHCSPDCKVHQATLLAQKNQYDIFILPGGSGVRKIFQKNGYEGVIGVACTDELQMILKIVDQFHIAAQTIPLTKNGCSNTDFDIETLVHVMKNNGTQGQSG
ncbi:MAG: DUF116 domain-containing protein [Methanobacteriota archaeon]